MTTDHEHSDRPLSDIEIRVKALESLLIDKGYVHPDTLERLIQTYEHEVGPHHGARVVARAWTDESFAEHLRADATAAVASMGYSGRQGEHLVAVENTPGQHNLVVCTLCSCYPWPVLGLPPAWYKSPAFRSQAVIRPREVLRTFGLNLPESTQVRVWDSTAEIRYLVIPMRPEGTQGWSLEALAGLVNRDSMIGTAVVSR
ncbi:MAG: nitrile hydratase subunit alpha [Betaproteobacteria bacterium]|nr:nitrile hydratase subunit alpha [Betaproteobacteria bacterium]